MRRSHRKKRKGVLAEINVVPYIDVMLVLLVIFMITAPLLTQGIDVNLPKAQARAISAKSEMPIILSVNQTGQYFLNTSANPARPINAVDLMNQVAAQLKLAHERHEKQAIYVKGDRYVDYGKVVQAMALLQRAGAENVGLITDNTAG